MLNAFLVNQTQLGYADTLHDMGIITPLLRAELYYRGVSLSELVDTTAMLIGRGAEPHQAATLIIASHDDAAPVLPGVKLMPVPDTVMADLGELQPPFKKAFYITGMEEGA